MSDREKTSFRVVSMFFVFTLIHLFMCVRYRETLAGKGDCNLPGVEHLLVIFVHAILYFIKMFWNCGVK